MSKKYPVLKANSRMPFGKHKGELMKNIPKSYIHWLCQNTNVKVDLLNIIQNKKSEQKPKLSTEQIVNRINSFIKERENREIESREEFIKKVVFLANWARITKRGNPTIHDWDDEVKYEKPKEFYGQHFN